MERQKPQGDENPSGERLYPRVIVTNPDENAVFCEPIKQNSMYPSVHSNPEASAPPSSSLYPSISVDDMRGKEFYSDLEKTHISPEKTRISDNQDQAAQSAEVVKMDPYAASAPCEATEEVLIRVPGAIVHLIDKEESSELASGEFCLVRLLQGSDAVAVFARIGEDIQWPLAKDQAAVKVDDCHYFFSLRVPNEAFNDESEKAEKSGSDSASEAIINYGLTFAARGQDAALRELDGLLKQYSLFSKQKVSGSGKAGLFEDMSTKEIAPSDLSSEKTKHLAEEKSAAYWTTLAPNVEDYSHTAARAIASGSGQLIRGILWCGDVTVERLRWGNEFLKRRLQPGDNASEMSPEAMCRIQRAKRVTKMSHKVAKGVLSGVVKVSGLVAGSVANSKAGKKFFSLLPGEVVLASLDAFVKVFDAVEVTGTNVLKTSSEVTADIVSHRYGEQAGQFTKEGLGAAGYMIGTAWTVSKLRNALNPKNALKPSTVAKAAVKEAAKSAAKDVAKAAKKDKKPKQK